MVSYQLLILYSHNFFFFKNMKIVFFITKKSRKEPGGTFLEYLLKHLDSNQGPGGYVTLQLSLPSFDVCALDYPITRSGWIHYSLCTFPFGLGSGLPCFYNEGFPEFRIFSTNHSWLALPFDSRLLYQLSYAWIFSILIYYYIKLTCLNIFS